MFKRGFNMVNWILLFLLATSAAFGSDLFLFDLEKNTVLLMGSEETAFTEKMQLEKVPNLMMQTSNPDQYIVVYLPEQNKQSRRKSWRPVQEAPRTDEKCGRLLMVDVKSGRTVDMVEIGYPPFRTALSKDKKHFLVSYRTEPEGGTYELVHYNVQGNKTEKITGLLGINDLEFSPDSNTAYALTEEAVDQYEMATLDLNPLKIRQSITAGKYPGGAFALSKNRVAILDFGSKTRVFGSDAKKIKGSIKLVDTDKNEILQEVQFTPSQIWFRWFKDEKILFLRTSEFDKTTFFKVNIDGVKTVVTDPSGDYEYVPETDTLYVLTRNRLETRGLTNNAHATIKTGQNWFFYSDGDVSFYLINVLPEVDIAVVYSIFHGNINFYDLKTNSLIKSIKGSPIKEKFRPDFNMKTVVTTNQDKSRIYILNRAKKGVDIFNEKLEPMTTVNLENELPIGMYQIKKPTLQTVLITEKALYKVEDDHLKNIFSFPSKVKEAYMLQDEKRLIFFVNDSWYIVDPATFELKYTLNEFGDSNDKYTKVKKGERRYYYVPSPYDWSE